MQMIDDSLQLLPGGEQFANDRLQVLLPFHGADRNDAAKEILVGTFNRGLFLFDGHSFRPFRTEADNFLRENTLYGSTILSDGTYGLITLNGGFLILQRDGKVRQHLDQASGLPGNAITTIFVDRQGTVWLGPEGGISLV